MSQAPAKYHVFFYTPNFCLVLMVEPWRTFKASLEDSLSRAFKKMLSAYLWVRHRKIHLQNHATFPKEIRLSHTFILRWTSELENAWPFLHAHTMSGPDPAWRRHLLHEGHLRGQDESRSAGVDQPWQHLQRHSKSSPQDSSSFSSFSGQNLGKRLLRDWKSRWSLSQ